MSAKLKFAVAWLASEVLFWIGCAASKTITDNQAIAYTLYNWCMSNSARIDEWGSCGLWQHHGRPE